MPSFDRHHRTLAGAVSRFPADASTLLLTASFSVIFVAIAVFGRVEARTASSGPQDMRIIDIWRAALDGVPAQAPVFLTFEVLSVLSFIAIVAISYAIAITIRFSRT
jgi:hypothetical protein